MEGRDAKRARLLDLRTRIPYCSHSALAALLRIAAEEGLPEGANRSDIAAARDSVTSIDTPYGKLHQQINVPTLSGPELKLEVQAPFPCLWHACRASAHFSAMLQRKHAAKPSSLAEPWQMILYCDEVLPGNQLAYRTERKFWAFYWSILDLGSAVLADEAAQQAQIARSASRQQPHYMCTMYIGMYIHTHTCVCAYVYAY